MQPMTEIQKTKELKSNSQDKKLISRKSKILMFIVVASLVVGGALRAFNGGKKDMYAGMVDGYPVFNYQIDESVNQFLKSRNISIKNLPKPELDMLRSRFTKDNVLAILFNKYAKEVFRFSLDRDQVITYILTPYQVKNFDPKFKASSFTKKMNRSPEGRKRLEQITEIYRNTFMINLFNMLNLSSYEADSFIVQKKTELETRSITYDIATLIYNDKIEVSDEEVHNYYHSHKKEFAQKEQRTVSYFGLDKVGVKTNSLNFYIDTFEEKGIKAISMQVSVETAQVDSKEKIEKIKNKIKKGSSFESAVNSILTKSAYSKISNTDVFDLKPQIRNMVILGQLKEMGTVKTEDGYLLVKLVEQGTFKSGLSSQDFSSLLNDYKAAKVQEVIEQKEGLVSAIKEGILKGKTIVEIAKTSRLPLKTKTFEKGNQQNLSDTEASIMKSLFKAKLHDSEYEYALGSNANFVFYHVTDIVPPRTIPLVECYDDIKEIIKKEKVKTMSKENAYAVYESIKEDGSLDNSEKMDKLAKNKHADLKKDQKMPLIIMFADQGPVYNFLKDANEDSISSPIFPSSDTDIAFIVHKKTDQKTIPEAKIVAKNQSQYSMKMAAVHDMSWLLFFSKRHKVFLYY